MEMNNKHKSGSRSQDVTAGLAQFPDETAYLEKINRILDKALSEAESDVEQADRDYMDMKRYMADNRGELDPHEMFRNELELKQIDSTGAFKVEVRDKTAKLKDSPYFARIDFRCEDEKNADVIYIGRFSFSHDNELLISDWRSPAAGMFYEHEVGPAWYTAPAGIISGELIRKRQFKIKNGVMEYALESSVNIKDNILQKELSRTSDEKMKSIIATIQKEQDFIIRNDKADTLIIQGAAGSGKTSIALHRIAYLLYRTGGRLTAKNITVLSPNKVFGDYISGVLPELGEEPVYEISLKDIAEVQLEGVIGFEEEKDPLGNYDKGWAERVRFKSSLDFAVKLMEFAGQLPCIAFEPADYSFGKFSETAESIARRFKAYEKYPVKQRLKMISEDIYDRFETDNIMGDDMPKIGVILKALRQMLKFRDSLPLYREFYKRCGMPGMFSMPDKNTLEWADVYPFLYIRSKYDGLRESGVIKHLVIDEMQDYTPVQYTALNIIFKCQKTILGDFGQFLNPNHLHTLEDLKKIYAGAEYAELNKSYRSTYEIITFAKKIKDTGNIEAVERHGEAPSVINCLGYKDELEHIKTGIKAYYEKGYSSLGIITKTNKDAKKLYDLLSGEYDVHLISKESVRFVNGISVTSVQMSKGLEFDEVIITGAGNDKYGTEYDRSLLYIACTRAMHRLTLLYSGEVSPHIV